MATPPSYYDLTDSCEEILNSQITVELRASYTYRIFAAYLNRSDVAYPNLSRFFLKSADEETAHAQMLIDYVNRRGGNLKFSDVTAPQYVYDKPQHIFEVALDMEKIVYKNLKMCHKTAQQSNDAQMEDMLERMLEEQVNSIKQLADYLTQINRCTTPFETQMFNDNFKN